MHRPKQPLNSSRGQQCHDPKQAPEGNGEQLHKITVIFTYIFVSELFQAETFISISCIVTLVLSISLARGIAGSSRTEVSSAGPYILSFGFTFSPARECAHEAIKFQLSDHN